MVFKSEIQELATLAKQLEPDIKLSWLDYGYTLEAMVPWAPKKILILCETYRPERDGATGFRIMTKERLTEILTKKEV